MIQVMNLRKSYKGCEAVKGISFSVKKGEIFALLGPNGAGKSTTLNILSTIASADGGRIIIDGIDVHRNAGKVRKKIGVVFQTGTLDDALTVKENLMIRGSLYGLGHHELKNRLMVIGRMTGADSFMRQTYGTLSGGQRRRCDIARALLPMPKVLLLDEPTTGLDPEMRAIIWKTIEHIRKETDLTIILTTHYMEEAANADKIAIMKDGRIIAEGEPHSLKNRFSKDNLILFSGQIDLLGKTLEQKHINYVKKKGQIKVPLGSTKEAIPILEYCRGRYSDFEVIQGNMEDAYLSVIERGERDV